MKIIDRGEVIKFRQKYRSIGSVKCPALENEMVYFGRSGFNHLLRKGKRLRDGQVQWKRLSLLQFAPYILKMAKQYETHTVTNDPIHPKKLINYWTFVRYGLLERKITLVVRQIENGKKEFYSIFS